MKCFVPANDQPTLNVSGWAVTAARETSNNGYKIFSPYETKPRLLSKKNFLNCRANVTEACKHVAGAGKKLWLVSRGIIEFSGKGYEQLFDGPFNRPDVQNAIAYGQVMKKERDEIGVAKYKYTIIGPALNGDPLYCCGKIRKRHSGEEYFIITFHGAVL